MWFIILLLSFFILWMAWGILSYCDWFPGVRGEYRRKGWEDGERASREPLSSPGHPGLVLRSEYGGNGLVTSYWATPQTDLTMSDRRFTYYLEGYQAALEHARWREGITVTRRSELDRVRRLDREIRQAHQELREEA